MSKCVFITATDTEQGKTTVTERLLNVLCYRGIEAAGFKPVAAGAELVEGQLQNEDAQKLNAASYQRFDYQATNPVCFAEAIAPHLAGDIQVQQLDQAFSEIKSESELVLVEGAGGWLLPLNNRQTLADWVQFHQMPVILVVGMRLGCLNHALLTAESIQQRGLKLAGWVANQASPEIMPYLRENIDTLKEALNAPYMGYMPHADEAAWLQSEPFRTWLTGFEDTFITVAKNRSV